MWQVDIKNEHKIYEINNVFLEDLFEWLSNNKGISKEDIDNSNSSVNLKSLYEKCPRLKDEMFNLASCSDIDNVKDMYIDYRDRYDYYITSGNLQQIEIDVKTLKIIKKSFSYFYDDLIDTKSFWEFYSDGDYKSKNDYRKKIGKIKHFCPYCDINRIESSKFSNTDHFLPISLFPVLGVYWKNFVVSCLPCNTAIKNDAIKLPILHPYINKIQDEIIFEFDFLTKEIRVKPYEIGLENIRAKNFIEIFKLDEIYKELWIVIDSEEQDLVREITRTNNLLLEQLGELNDSTIINVVKRTIEERSKSIYSQKGLTECTKMKVDFYNYYKEKKGKDIEDFLKFEKYSLNYEVVNNFVEVL